MPSRHRAAYGKRHGGCVRSHRVDHVEGRRSRHRGRDAQWRRPRPRDASADRAGRRSQRPGAREHPRAGQDLGRLRGATRPPLTHAGGLRGHRRRDARGRRGPAAHLPVSPSPTRAASSRRGASPGSSWSATASSSARNRSYDRPRRRTLRGPRGPDPEPSREAQRALGRAPRRDQRRPRRHRCRTTNDEVRRDRGRRLGVLRGFRPLGEFTRAAGDAEFERELWASSDRYHDTVLRFPLPTIASVNGPALAGGFDLAVLCDLRIAGADRPVRAPRTDLRRRRVRTAARSRRRGGRARADDRRPRDRRGRSTPAVTSSARSSSPTRCRDATEALVARVCAAPRDVLMRTKAKALRRAGFGGQSPTLDL